MALTRTSTVVCLSKMDSIYRIYFRCQRHTSESKTILFDAKSTLGKCSSTHINTKIVLNEFVHRQHPDMFDFNNGQEAYKSKHTSALVRALLVFNLCSIEFIVRNQQKASVLFGILYVVSGVNHRLLKIECTNMCAACYSFGFMTCTVR